MIYPKLAKQAGLVPTWKNDEGEIEYIGTNRQWNTYAILEAEHEEYREMARMDAKDQQAEREVD